MADEKEKEMNVDVVDTMDEPVENEPRAEERVDEKPIRTATPAARAEEQLAPLFEADDAKKFRSRWLVIQSKFVDDPSAAVKEADDLVSDVIKSVTMNFSNKRIALEKQWNAEENVSTEDLRMAIKRYRSFFDRLLTLES
jgi:hypothetical protein